MFANGTDAELLGKPTVPEELTLEYLKGASSQIGAAQTTSSDRVLQEAVLLKTPTHQRWRYVVGQTFLKPFGLESTGTYLAESVADMQRIKRNNPALAKATFFTPSPNRPSVYVMLSMLLAPLGYMDSNVSGVGLQISPGWIGSPFYPNGSTVDYQRLDSSHNIPPDHLSRLVGGGFVEAFAFNGAQPADQGGKNGGQLVDVGAPTVPFSLADAVAASSWAPGAGLGSSALGEVWSPRAEYWPVLSDDMPGPDESLAYELADGGNIDNSGLLPQLQRNASKVIWVAN